MSKVTRCSPPLSVEVSVTVNADCREDWAFNYQLQCSLFWIFKHVGGVQKRKKSWMVLLFISLFLFSILSNTSVLMLGINFEC